MKNKFPIAAAALALLTAACSTDESQLSSNMGEDPNQNGEASTAPAGPAWFFGTIHQVPPNSGVWVIRTAGGMQYQPNALPAEFQVEGMAVEVEARKHNQVMTKDTLGQQIDIVKIRKQGSDSN